MLIRACHSGPLSRGWRRQVDPLALMGVCALQRGLYHVAESVRMGVKEERGAHFAYHHGANFENDISLGHSDRAPKEALPSLDRQL